MTATNPSGYILVACGGSSSPNAAGTSATESVTVPTGGAGVGIFYVAQDAPAITLTKSATETSYDAVGQTIHYSYLVTNTGNVTLDPVSVTDPMTNLSAISCPATSLAPSIAETCTATYSTTQGDLNAGSIHNTGTATGTPPSGPDVTDTSSVTIPATQGPAITLTKSATETSYDAVGQTIHYSYLVTNTGNVTLDPVSVTDPMTNLSAISCPATSLAPSIAETCTATYSTTQGDLNAGSIHNTATASGTPPIGSPVTSSPSSVTVPVARPTFAIHKTATPSIVTTVGQTIIDTFVVTNTGNVTLTRVGVDDIQAAPAGPLTTGPTCISLASPSATCSGGLTTLTPGQVATFTGTYTVTQADLAAGSVADVGTAGATPIATTSAMSSAPSPVIVPTTNSSTLMGPLAFTGIEIGALMTTAVGMFVTGLGLVFSSARKRRRTAH